MQVILREDVPNLGRSGELVTVKEGFGRNYLIPRGLAVVATGRNVARLDHEQHKIEQREQKLLRSAAAIKQKIEQTSINIAKQVGEEEKLFGSVTTREIADALAAAGVEVDRKAIHLDEPIRTLGVHSVKVKLRRDVEAVVKVWVVASE
jgi:large subunit ribosomal protein L9